jgi:peptide/nickel transport system permease protein
MTENLAETTKVERTMALGQEDRVYVATQWQLMWWRFRKHKLALVSTVILAILYTIIIFVEFFAPYDPRVNRGQYLYAPPQKIHFVDAAGRFHLWPFTYAISGKMDPDSLRIHYQEDTSTLYPIRFFVRGDPYKLWGLIESDIHLFGTGQEGTFFLLGTEKQGRDMLSRILYGGRISTTIGLVGMSISFFLGLLLGGLSGYYGGLFDLILQRIIEFIRAVPGLPLWMGLSAALPPRWSVVQVYFGMGIILSLIGWTGLARVVRSKFMSLREEDFVMAAQLAGANELRIVFRHMVPSFASHLIASLTMSIPGMILGETSLSFIGLGLQPPAISWGVLLKQAQAIRVLAEAPWLLYPAVPIVIVVLTFNFMGDGLRDAADPYSR